jgi:hypothetical protein
VSSLAGILAVAPAAIGTLSRERMLAAAAPTTSRHASATMVIALVKQFSVLKGANHNQFPENQWSGFDLRHRPGRKLAKRMSNPELHLNLLFASGPSFLTFANVPAAMLETDHWVIIKA